MKIKMFQVDAFTSELFSGNPAAVCLLNEWLSDELMLSIASENNLSETAFLNLSDDPIGIRWFSPLRKLICVAMQRLLHQGYCLIIQTINPEMKLYLDQEEVFSALE